MFDTFHNITSRGDIAFELNSDPDILGILSVKGSYVKSLLKVTALYCKSHIYVALYFKWLKSIFGIADNVTFVIKQALLF